MDGLVALNHATGLRFLHYEDVAVGVWVSGMRLKFITDQDVGYRFVGHAQMWGQEELDALKVRQRLLCRSPLSQSLMPDLRRFFPRPHAHGAWIGSKYQPQLLIT